MLARAAMALAANIKIRACQVLDADGQDEAGSMLFGRVVFIFSFVVVQLGVVSSIEMTAFYTNPKPERSTGILQKSLQCPVLPLFWLVSRRFTLNITAAKSSSF